MHANARAKGGDASAQHAPRHRGAEGLPVLGQLFGTEDLQIERLRISARQHHRALVGQQALL